MTKIIVRNGGNNKMIYRSGKNKINSNPSTTPSITGLDFAGNTSFPSTTLNTPILAWNSTILGGTAPFAIYPATYIWKCYPRHNNDAYGSFWTFLFHCRWQTSAFDQSFQRYYGVHPYPDNEDSGINKWEISAGGGDHFTDAVVFDQWYTQVFTAELIGGNEVYTYYWNWPNTTTDVQTYNATQASVNTDPAIIIGDAPWNRGKEAPNAILRGYQFYDAVLSEANIAAELASPGSFRTPWYLNLNPTPIDVTDKSGNGHDPLWYDSNRPALWTG